MEQNLNERFSEWSLVWLSESNLSVLTCLKTINDFS